MIRQRGKFSVYNYVKEDNLKGYMLYDSKYMNDILIKVKLQDNKQISAARVKWKRRMKMQSTEDFQGTEIILYDSTIMDTCYTINVFKLIKYTIPRGHPNANYEL